MFYYNDGTPPQASASVKFSVKASLPDKLLLDEKTSVYGQIKKSMQEKAKDKTFSQETDYSTDKFTI